MISRYSLSREICNVQDTIVVKDGLLFADIEGILELDGAVCNDILHWRDQKISEYCTLPD